MADIPLPPPDETVVSAALTDAQVRVTSGFRGAKLTVYGAVFDPDPQPSDVVIIVRGPEQPIRLAQKVNVFGLWLNSRPVVFRGAPGYYMAASTRPLGEIARFGTLRRLGAGLDHLAFAAPDERRVETRYGVRDMVVSSLGPDYLLWRRAVVRLKQDAGLYSADSTKVKFVDQGLFRAEIDLPADAPIGRYQASVILFQDGEPVSIRERALSVEKVGMERALYLLAHRRPWLYGLISVAIALAAGWATSRAFRRS